MLRGLSGERLLPLGSLIWYHPNMGKSIKVIPKRRGRPATGRDPLISLRLPAYMISAVEAWARGKGLSRSEAVRQMIEQALGKAKR